MNNQPIVTEVQLINNDGQKIIRGEHAHIREFTPLTCFDQRSFDNTPEENNQAVDIMAVSRAHHQNNNNMVSNFVPRGGKKSGTTMLTTESEEDADKSLQQYQNMDDDAPDKSVADSITQGAMISNSNSMTRQEARHSKMVPMMEKNSALLVDVEKVSEE